MPLPLEVVVERWLTWAGLAVEDGPEPQVLAEWAAVARDQPCREPAAPEAIASWEQRHGFELPAGLRTLLLLTNGLYRQGPLVHPISAIGPMIPFAATPGLLIQPESWFELGNPNLQTVCVDLAYRLPGGGCPVFTSGDDHVLERPRVIARGFDEWFLELLRRGGREYWFEAGFRDLGEPWGLHRRYVERPTLEGRLRTHRDRAFALAEAGVGELEIAARLGLEREDVETILRHVQHAPHAPEANSPSQTTLGGRSSS